MGRIALNNIRKSFGAVDVIHGVSLEIEDGELVVFVGPSGCGKSTLLRLIAGLDAPTSGTIHIDGEDATRTGAADRGLAMVFQSYALYPHMTVRQNLSFGLENSRMPKAKIEERVSEAGRILEIEDLMARRPTQLSGGQRQRVAIGRAIVRNPTAFLLDEPLSNLDAELRGSMRAELAALHARLATTMIYVTHDQIEAMTLADRIVVLRRGVVEQVDTPLNLYNRPANLFVAGFIGAPAMNFFAARAQNGSAELPGGLVVPVTVDGPVTLGIRPQHMTLAKRDEAGIPAKVTLVEALGAETVIHAVTAPGVAVDPVPEAHATEAKAGVMGKGHTVVIVVDGQPEIRRDQEIALTFDMGQMHAFDKDGLRIG
ncbi:ABC transporter ATP-binding protein [Roseicitreum antarcticum]|uniref:Multiple sugar transport system ATP-binding protein n=1 Tax=Roseicitreum antarcticum TaxID=564137 RepID=A0A1H3CZV1_9RHOB|nr:sn-glycerol-3-phosphate ABC transporter ATP-binding protein UgpC [Roseicitreum antarcticum]SDX59560.1 multiple sugar transport system ATP-binding protein [Roseicitreum antarcticum]